MMRFSSPATCIQLTAILLIAIGATAAQQGNTTPKIGSPSAPTPATVEQKPAQTPPEQKPTEEKNTGIQQSAPVAASPEETIPTTTVFPEPKEKVYLDPQLTSGPLPKGKIALIGGTIRDIDQIRNRATLDIFGGGKMKLIFDERTHFDRNGVETSQLSVKPGDHVYADTQLANGKIFARNIHVRTAAGIAAASGQIVAYNSRSGEVSMRDQISLRPVNFRLTPSTVIKNKGAEGSRADLRPNALVSVRLSPGPGNRRVANEIDVIAVPGSQFTFYGTLTHLDLRSGILAVDNKSDNKLYEIRFVPAQIGVTDDLIVGADVAVVASFNGQDYTAQSVKVNRTARSNVP